jgi:hypothetical protein
MEPNLDIQGPEVLQPFFEASELVEGTLVNINRLGVDTVTGECVATGRVLKSTVDKDEVKGTEEVYVFVVNAFAPQGRAHLYGKGDNFGSALVNLMYVSNEFGFQLDIKLAA